MNLEDIDKLKDFYVPPYLVEPQKEKWGCLILGHKIAIPIEGFASYYETDCDISVFCADKEIGLLSFTKELGNVSWSDMTENQFIAYLNEAPFPTSEDSPTYTFSKNYLLIEEHFYEEYLSDYYKTSALWGGFFHKNPDLSTNSEKKKVNEITVSKIDLISPIYEENITRAILQPFAFERYLKLYHLLELRFDIDVIKKIQSLDIDSDLDKIGEMLNDYSSKEIERLHDILYANCTNFLSLIPLLNTVVRFEDVAMDIFFKFGSGKDGNPLKKQELSFIDVLPYGFDEKNLKKYKINYNCNHRKFILDLTTYWIYRVRCCIAHNKIGEYILRKNQENFIVDFAEPLLLNILKQCFKIK